MEIRVTKTFVKQYQKCPAHVKEAANEVIKSLENAKTLAEINNLKKLSGFKKYYRIRIGQYRLGLKEEKPKILVLCLMERSQIYKELPPK